MSEIEPEAQIDENGQRFWKCKHCGEKIVENSGSGQSYIHHEEPYLDRLWCWKEGCSSYFAEPEGSECSSWCRGGKPEDEKEYWDDFYENHWGWVRGTISPEDSDD